MYHESSIVWVWPYMLVSMTDHGIVLCIHICVPKVCINILNILHFASNFCIVTMHCNNASWQWWVWPYKQGKGVSAWAWRDASHGCRRNPCDPHFTRNPNFIFYLLDFIASCRIGFIIAELFTPLRDATPTKKGFFGNFSQGGGRGLPNSQNLCFKKMTPKTP